MWYDFYEQRCSVRCRWSSAARQGNDRIRKKPQHMMTIRIEIEVDPEADDPPYLFATADEDTLHSYYCFAQRLLSTKKIILLPPIQPF